jgi:hypothetical protein
MKVAVAMIEKLDGIIGCYQTTRKNIQFKMAYKKNKNKLEQAIIKLQEIKEKNENILRNTKQPGNKR